MLAGSPVHGTNPSGVELPYRSEIHFLRRTTSTMYKAAATATNAPTLTPALPSLSTLVGF
jgi:hypothetical protein